MGDSYWMHTTDDACCPSLTRSQKVDIAVIGGGLSGLHSALKISEDNPDVRIALLEKNRVCSDASGRTMAKLAVSHSRIFPRLSAEEAKRYLQANQEGFDRTIDLIEKYRIDCGLKRITNYIFATSEKHLEHVKKDYTAMRRVGLDVEWLDFPDIDLPEIPLNFLGCIRHRNQAEFHPRAFALGMLHVLQDRGVNVFEHTKVENISEQNKAVLLKLENNAVLEAQKVIVATRVGILPVEPYDDALSSWRSHMNAYVLNERLIRDVYTRYDPVVTSFRSHGADLILGGSDTTTPPCDHEKHYEAIHSWAKQAFAQISADKQPKALSWSGEDLDSYDRLPLIGPYRKGSQRVFMASGFSGWGMTKSAFAGLMLADLVAGKHHYCAHAYTPWRTH